jgi:hypothetical protein
MSPLISKAILLSSVVALSIGVFSCGAGKRPSPAPAFSDTHFAVLGVASGPDDVLPTELAASLRKDGTPPFMRVRRVVAGSNPGWLALTATDELCLIHLTYPLLSVVNGQSLTPLPSRICTSEDEAGSGHLVDTESLIAQVGGMTRNIVIGVVPNGVATVKIKEENGRVIAASVTRNGYEAMTAHPRSVGFVSRGHKYVVQVRGFNSNKARYQAPKGSF